MAERKMNVTNKMNIFHGVILRSTIEEGQIVDIQLPEMDNRFLVLAARDIPGNNRVQVLNTQFPLLTSSQVTYLGQPILALFGNEIEAVELKAKEILISYKLPQEQNEILQSTELKQEETDQTSEEPVDHTVIEVPTTLDENNEERDLNDTIKRQLAVGIPPYDHQWGDCSAIFAQPDIEVFERKYSFRPCSSNTTSITRAVAARIDDQLHIEVPTQWPFHVRDTVSEVTGISKKKIMVFQQPYYAAYDEKLIEPSILASLAAIAADITGFTVEIQSQQSVFSPAIEINRKTAMATSGAPLAEAIDVKVDQGAYPLFSSEFAAQLIAGLVPLYPLEAMNIHIATYTSTTPPANFFGDLGYSKAVGSTESHYSLLARKAGMNPADWRYKYLGESAERTAQIASLRFSRLKEMLARLCEKSDYQRKHASYMTQQNKKLKISTFLNYCRGMGIACGAGISGFSSSFRNENQFTVQATLEANDKALLNTSFPIDTSSAKVWKAIVARELDINLEDISFVEDPSELVDTGPAVLSRNIGRLPLMFERACDSIKAQRFIEPLPLVASIGSKLTGVSGSQFYSDSWAALILELEIDSIALHPIIRHVWASFDFGYVHDKHALQSKIHNIIARTLVENGAQLSTQKGNEFSMDIEISSQSKGEPISISSVLHGLVIAALEDATAQAISLNQSQLPIMAEDILENIKGVDA